MHQEEIRTYFTGLQDRICGMLEQADGAGRFREDRWLHPSGGGGRSRILERGGVFEKAGVNYSAVTTPLSETLAVRLGVPPQDAFATGISLVIHPVNPMVPVVHLNLRYFSLAGGDAWFGGGADLTPSYLFEEDARHFHSVLKACCDRYEAGAYGKFKEWCDAYFTIRHRHETRGVGGIFFDYLRGEPEKTISFIRDVGDNFPASYLPIVERRMDLPWTGAEKEWQMIRRGRYVEFNLVYDRGTLFGLETGGRTESVLMSLPPAASWQYNSEPAAGSREEALLIVLRQPRSWI